MFLPKLMICVVVMLVKIQSFQDLYIQHKRTKKQPYRFSIDFYMSAKKDVSYE